MEGRPITLRLKKPSTDVVQLTLTLKMTTTWVETSVTVNNSHTHDYSHYIDTTKYDRCQWCNESNTASSVEHSWLKSFVFFLKTQQRVLTPTSQMVENHKKMELCGKHPHLQTLVKVGTRRLLAFGDAAHASSIPHFGNPARRLLVLWSFA